RLSRPGPRVAGMADGADPHPAPRRGARPQAERCPACSCIVSFYRAGHGGLASTGKAVDLKWGWEASSPYHSIAIDLIGANIHAASRARARAPRRGWSDIDTARIRLATSPKLARHPYPKPPALRHPRTRQ